LQALPAPNTYRGSGVDVIQTTDVVAVWHARRPGNDCRALAGAFNASGLDHEDPFQLVARSGKGQVSTKRLRHRKRVGARNVSNQRVKAAGKLAHAATVAIVLDAQ
jgi:hypothetical protein